MKQGRRKPYTNRGISRVPCAACGAPSVHQWSVCSLDNRYLGVCRECDIAVNAWVLKFMRVRNVASLMRRYIKRQRWEA